MAGPPHARARSGITLLEVVISLAIFMMSLAALVHLVTAASNRAVLAQHRQRAALLCQSKLADFASGSQALDSQKDGSFTDREPGWGWTANVAEGDFPNLKNVTVTVKRDLPTGQTVQVSMTQMIIDPASRGSTADTTKAPAAEGISSAPATGGTGGTPSTGGTPGTSGATTGGTK
jgi:type II secretion system protein I